MRSPLILLRPFLAIPAAVAFAAPASAISVAFSQTEIVFEAAALGGVRSTLTLHLEDLADPSPTTGQIRLSITGHLKQPAYRKHSLDVVGLFFFWDHSRSSVRAVLGQSVFSDPRMGARTFSPSIDPPNAPTFAWIEFDMAADRKLDWTSTATLLLDRADRPSSLLIDSLYAREDSIIPRCDLRRYCHPRFDYPEWVEVTVTPVGSEIRFMPIPEPTTGLLMIAGMLGLTCWRRVHA